MRRQRLFYVSFILSFVVSMLFTSSAMAWVAWGYKWPSSNIKYYYDNYNSTRGKTFITAGAHELGHALGLFENGTTSTIMNAYTFGTNSRYGGYELVTPQADDITGANTIY